jgi:ribonuclease Y
MELVIAAVVGLLLGGAGIFFVKKVQDDAKKKSARAEAERILNRAKSEAAKVDKDSKNRAKDFESRARKNVEVDIQKQKSQLKNKESQLERKLKEIDDQLKQKLEENERYIQGLKSREEKIAIAEGRISDSEKKTEQTLGDLKRPNVNLSKLSRATPKSPRLKKSKSLNKRPSAKRIAARSKFYPWRCHAWLRNTPLNVRSA